ncbi:hypothetical protein NLG97_g4826 [Lecanicillium saksenae]|uniref:Uncharacterized protein n=1 Tax=Lecanicillium saksenae TaxID=468837 RepID=A0ACC1QU67_9HYPO|nr:hypothetical protein NLG97_g4826 [Lecanicillium saksenae]
MLFSRLRISMAASTTFALLFTTITTGHRGWSHTERGIHASVTAYFANPGDVKAWAARLPSKENMLAFRFVCNNNGTIGKILRALAPMHQVHLLQFGASPTQASVSSRIEQVECASKTVIKLIQEHQEHLRQRNEKNCYECRRIHRYVAACRREFDSLEADVDAETQSELTSLNLSHALETAVGGDFAVTQAVLGMMALMIMAGLYWV